MVNNNLIDVGKDFEDDKKDIKHTTNRVTKLEPIVEKCMDRLGTLYTYRMEFYTYAGASSAFLDVVFYPKFIDLIYG